MVSNPIPKTAHATRRTLSLGVLDPSMVDTPRSIGEHFIFGRPDGLHDCQSRQHRPLGIVLVGNRCAEERRDGVSRQRRQCTFVALDQRDQVIEGPVHDLCPVFKAQPLGCGREAGHDAVVHRKHAAFTLNPALLRADSVLA